MKRFFLILCLFPFIGFSQGSYIPLPDDSNATWRYDYFAGSVQCPPDGICYSVNVKVLRDTLINGLTYHITDAPAYISLPAYRNDTINKKVYFPYEISQGNYSDTILLDFSLNIGDSIKQLLPGIFYNHIFYVTKIDSIFNGSVYLKQVWLNGSPAYIEGVGNVQGLFGEFGFFEESYVINCLVKDNISFYPDVNNGCSLVSVKEENLNSVSIYPNPLQRNQKLNLSFQNIKPKCILITDVFGQRLFYSDNFSNEIEFESENAGLYVVRVLLEDGRELNKSFVIY